MSRLCCSFARVDRLQVLLASGSVTVPTQPVEVDSYPGFFIAETGVIAHYSLQQIREHLFFSAIPQRAWLLSRQPDHRNPTTGHSLPALLQSSIQRIARFFPSVVGAA